LHWHARWSINGREKGTLRRSICKSRTLEFHSKPCRFAVNVELVPSVDDVSRFDMINSLYRYITEKGNHDLWHSTISMTDFHRRTSSTNVFFPEDWSPTMIDNQTRSVIVVFKPNVQGIVDTIFVVYLPFLQVAGAGSHVHFTCNINKTIDGMAKNVTDQRSTTLCQSILECTHGQPQPLKTSKGILYGGCRCYWERLRPAICRTLQNA